MTKKREKRESIAPTNAFFSFGAFTGTPHREMTHVKRTWFEVRTSDIAHRQEKRLWLATAINLRFLHENLIISYLHVIIRLKSLLLVKTLSHMFQHITKTPQSLSIDFV